MATSAVRQTNLLLNSKRGRVSWRWPTLLAWLPLQLWAAHAGAFFAHEYAHSFTVWLLGWKTNPLDLYFPPASPLVWLLQLGINQKVDEARLFATGHGLEAALIGAAGMLVGNALLSLSLSRLLWALGLAESARCLGALRLLGHGSQPRQPAGLCAYPHLHPDGRHGNAPARA